MLCSKTLRRRRTNAILLLLCAVVPAALVGCNSKVATNPNDNPAVAWRVELRAPAVMFRMTPGGHVSNDTIVVRVYNTSGQLQAGVNVSCWAQASPQTVSPVVTTLADTVNNPWGSDFPILYWGSGDPNPNVPEVITAKASLHGDTIATTQVSFAVKDPPSLVLMCADTMYRDGSGTVPHDTISVRAFASDGSILNAVVVHFSCIFSPDSVTRQASTYADTTLKPWGTLNPVTYWGSGPADPSAFEQVTASATIDGGTVTAQRSFKVFYH